MNTPIRDFVRHYEDSATLRLHMPGHKGISSELGCEKSDITEISGADSLYEAEGIIAQSEANASTLFGCHTFYSTEGSSQCIRAMVYLAMLQAKAAGKRPIIAAGRNVHKSFLSAAALLDVEVQWLHPRKQASHLSCLLEADDLEAFLLRSEVTAVYVTSPDYLGHVTDIAALSAVCHRYGVLLLVDNAHGAYLRFLEPSRHPMDLGADLCCDSAHKTLPVLTGGAYLHIGPFELAKQAKNALALFGSTSPSYLILQSLDLCNAYLDQSYRQRLVEFCAAVSEVKQALTAHGYTLVGDDPLKITISTKPFGYRGKTLAWRLQILGVECEFSDPDYLVLMVTPETGLPDLIKLKQKLLSISPLPPISEAPPAFSIPERVLSIREATLSPSETIPVQDSLGRILAAATVGCPPAVPVLVCGERIDENAVACFSYYGIGECCVTI